MLCSSEQGLAVSGLRLYLKAFISQSEILRDAYSGPQWTFNKPTSLKSPWLKAHTVIYEIKERNYIKPDVRLNFESSVLHVLLTTIFTPLPVPPFSGHTILPLQLWRNTPSASSVNWKWLSEHRAPGLYIKRSLSFGEQDWFDGVRQRSRPYDLRGVAAVGLTVETKQINFKLN